MADKNKQQNNKTVNILIVIITVLIITIAVLAVFSMNQQDEKPEAETKITMMDKINKLHMTENPVATLKMENGGIIEIELYPKVAPNTVCNFIELANSGYYDGLIFHRCIKDFMIQGGDPDGNGTGGPGYSIAGEFTSNGFENKLSHERGVVSMARSKELDSAGSQFFIMVADGTYLDGEYAAFGKVISGMDTADAIVANETNPSNDKPLVDQVIKSIRVDTKGITYPEAEKIK